MNIGRGHAARGLACALLLCALCLAARAQEDKDDVRPDVPRPDAARIVDSYGRITWEDQQARLDNFALELMNEPHLRAHLVVYGGRNDLPAVAERWADMVADYLVNTRGIDKERITLVNGGLKNQDDMLFELWAVPPGAPAPEPRPTFSDDNREAPTGKFTEYETDESSYYQCEDGPCVGRAEMNFVGWLRREPALRGYLVVYTSEKGAPGAALMIGKRERQSLLAGGEIEAERVKVICAGRGEKTKVELWLLPRDSPPPAAEAAAPPLPPAPFKLCDVNAYELSDADSSSWRREGLADLLRTHAGARAQLVIHPPDPQELSAEASRGEAAEEGEPEQDESGPQRVEPRLAAEEWKKILEEKYGIDASRVEIVTGRIEEGGTGTLAAWVVPEGAAPPDPFAEETEEVMTEEEAGGQSESEPPAEGEQPPPGGFTEQQPRGRL